MVNVEQENDVNEALDPDIQCRELDEVGNSDQDTGGITGSSVGVGYHLSRYPKQQEAFQTELQITPWNPSMDPQVNHPDSDTPVLDYQAQLKLLDDECKRGVMIAGEAHNAFTVTTVPHLATKQRREQDYRMQLMLMEHKNRRRQKMASRMGDPLSSTSKSSTGWRESLSPDSLRALEFLEKQHREHLAQDIGVRDISKDKRREIAPQMSEKPHPTLSEYQSQLRLLEQQKMDSDVTEDQEQSISPDLPRLLTPESTAGVREQSVDSAWCVHFTPESTPGTLHEQSLLNMMKEIKSNNRRNCIRNMESTEASQSECLQIN